MIIGYARVSTEDQNPSMQTQALQATGCTQIYIDHGISGSQTNRPGLEKALRRLKPGSKLVVWRLDRLSRSLIHLIKLLDQLASRDVQFQSITEHIDTSSSVGRLVFHMMAALAEFERSLISERTRAGLAAARHEGRRLGRRPSLSSGQCAEARHLRSEHGWTTSMVARHFGIHPRTLRRRIALANDLEPQHTSIGAHPGCPLCKPGSSSGGQSSPLTPSDVPNHNDCATRLRSTVLK